MKKRLFLLLSLLFFCFALALYFGRSDIRALFQRIFFSPETQSSVSVSSQKGEDKVKVVFLDIGQGDATFVEFSDGTQMLIDCALDARILEALGRVMKASDHTIDYLFVTHPDQDHYGGCVDVLERFEVKHIVYSGYKKTTSEYFPVFQDSVQKEGALYHEIASEEIWNISSTTLHFLYPDKPVETHPVVLATTKKEPSNNTSLVFILQYGKEKLLFTGDAEFEIENYLLKKYSPELLDVDVLKVGHHGSSGSSSAEFLSALTPEYAFISAGKKNRYGHPTLRTLKRLERVNAEVWRTDQRGDIIINVSKDHVYVENE